MRRGRDWDVTSDMHNDDEPISQLRGRLKIYRNNLQTYLKQQALVGAANTPLPIVNGIAEARREIRQIKQELRRLGVAVGDLPDDAEGAPAPPAESVDHYDLRRRARRAYFAGNLAEAIPLLEQICRLEPDNTEYRTWLEESRAQYDEQERFEDIRYLLSEGNWQAALRAIDAVERRYPPTPALDDLRRQAEGLRRTMIVRPAQELIEREQYGAAISWLAQRLQLQPDDRDSAVYLASLIETPGVPLIHRVRAAEIVGAAGDPRIPVSPDGWRSTLQKLLAEGYWCAVTAGADAPRPQSPQLSGAFWLARYPLTNSQYQAFVQDGGYSEPRWWQPEGWAWRERRFAITEPIAIGPIGSGPPNQPLVGLNWYEALAFCGWLSDQIGDLIPAGYQLRPPTETEWEAAAFYDRDGRPRRYPWGDGPLSPDHAVYRTGATNSPLAVGCCPAGRAACGALDLIGNVHELLAPPEQPDMAQGELLIPWRGGSWGSAAEELDRPSPMRRITRHLHYGGMRLAIGPSRRLP